MEKFTCPQCGKTTYTASKDKAQICPYCNTERFIIINPKALSVDEEYTEAKILFDRRNSEMPVDVDRRRDGSVVVMPLAWLVIKERRPAASTVS